MSDGTTGHEAPPAAGAARTMLVIAGMHRSGTSALARSCNLLGVDLGADFIPTQPDNRSGFWEDAGVKDADDAALASHGMLWDDVGPLPRPWRDGFGGAEVRQRLRSTLATLAARGSLCGVKDPRISRLLPLWLPLLDELEVVPVFLVALREPRAVARSLEHREGLGEPRALLLWLRYTLEAERDTRGRRRAFVCFDDLFGDWRAALARAARDAGIAWPVGFDDAAAGIDRFLDPSLRHHAAPESPVDGLARLAHDAFVAVRTLRDGEDPARHAELDRIRALLDAADLAFAPLLHELEQRASRCGDVSTSPVAGSEVDGSGDGAARSPEARELDRARREAMLAHELVGQRDRELAAAVERSAREAMLAHELVGQRDRELAAAVERFARERDALAARIAAGETAIAAASTRIASLEDDVAVLRRETEALRESRDAALAVIADVERSLSWRITSPLRALTAAARRRHAS